VTTADARPGRRFAFITPCGWGNLGDAAIVDSLVHAIRTRAPGVEITGYTLLPADTVVRHGVEAHPLSTFPLPYYPVAGESGPDYELPRYDGTQAPATIEEDGSPLERARRLAQRSMTGVRLVAGAKGLIRLGREPTALRELRDRLRGTEAIVVAGGGQLDALFGGVFGQPYVLLRWARLASAVGARFLVLSVGTGTLDVVERHVVLRALRRADHRSFRDETSKELLKAAWLQDDSVVPDLAYALPVTPRPPADRERLVVGVSPMNYQHPDFYPAADATRFELHVAGMHRISRALLERGHDVVLFTTDASDDVGLAEVRRRLEADTTHGDGRWSVSGARTVDELMDAYANFDAVVAARLHGALLAHVAHRPVLALAHERKVRTLMSQIGHERFCFDPADIDRAELDARLDELIASRVVLAQEVAAAGLARRAEVEAQFDEVFGPGPSA
jgi:polysaccharide pyruvyl transferase WcaK-like protein